VSATQTDDSQRWLATFGRIEPVLPYVLMAVSASLALALVLGGYPDGRRYLLSLAIAAVAVGAEFGWQRQPSRRRRHRGWLTGFYLLRWLLCLLLVLLNPFYGIYCFSAYLRVFDDHGRRLGAVWAVATAALTALSQMGGRPFGSVLQVAAFALLVALNACLAVALGGVGYVMAAQNERRRRSITALREANEKLARALAENAGLHAQLLAAAREAGVLDERARLAGEIHDTIAQDLAGIVSQLQAADREAGGEGELAVSPWRRRVAVATELARNGLREARRSVAALQPPALDDTPLPAALQAVVDRFSDGGQASARLTITGEPQPVPAETAAAMLRITQEALGNVGKHAHADQVVVTLTVMPGSVSVDVYDDGRGFDTSAPPRHHDGGFGLTGMRARAARLGGSLAIESRPGGGTVVSATLPTTVPMSLATPAGAGSTS
jgi:signal transduction histidine kinase